jgi:hypothetical protein
MSDHTLVRGGRVVAADGVGEILTAPGHGRYVPRSLTREAVAA